MLGHPILLQEEGAAFMDEVTGYLGSSRLNQLSADYVLLKKIGEII